MLEPIVDIARNECRYVVDAMSTPNVAAITDRTVVRNPAAINVLCFLQTIEEMAKQLGLIKFPLKVRLRSYPVALNHMNFLTKRDFLCQVFAPMRLIQNDLFNFCGRSLWVVAYLD